MGLLMRMSTPFPFATLISNRNESSSLSSVVPLLASSSKSHAGLAGTRAKHDSVVRVALSSRVRSVRHEDGLAAARLRDVPAMMPTRKPFRLWYGYPSH